MGLTELPLCPPRLPEGSVRRIFDIVTAALLLALALPLLAGAALFVLLAGGRPVFFGHHRLGRGGRVFRCWKLRTMTREAEALLKRESGLRDRHRENGFKLPSREDPRVPWWGRLLRQTYVDELPQLYNVLAGCMGLVGPRPIVPEELDLFGEDRETLLGVKPGIFGAWNSRGRARPPYPERARIEVEYVRGRSWRGDLAILVRSVVAVLQGQRDG